MNKQELLKRIKNPIFLGAAASFVYTVLKANGITLDVGTYQMGVDVVAFLVIGVGIYSTFGGSQEK
ncbi:MAG: hypothetical protein ACYC0N_00620 [Carboxydocellales bacterium]